MRKNMFEVLKLNFKELSNPYTKKLPKGFEQFIESEFCLEMGDSIRDYCECMLSLNKKKEQLATDAKARKIPEPKILKYEFDQVQRKAKRMSNNYARLVYQYRSVGNPDDDPLNKCNSQLQFSTIIIKNKNQHFYFYDRLCALFQKTMTEFYFHPDEKQKVEEEISRLFRTNAFNETERHNKHSHKLNQYKALRDIPAVAYGKPEMLK